MVFVLNIIECVVCVWVDLWMGVFVVLIDGVLVIVVEIILVV